LRAAEWPGRTPANLLSGPGKFSAALGLTVAYSGMDLLSDGDFRLFKARNENPKIGVSKRIGVEYAGESAEWPLRFFDIDSAAVSGPARLKVNTKKMK
jgi:DNA-3-methyladenine glycosylase